jgi:hypothetical protein
VNDANCSPPPAREAAFEPPELEVLVEVPRGSFLKRGSTGHVDFVSPLPCPFNYGSVPNYLGLEGDLLDALVLGPRLPLGTRIQVKAWTYRHRTRQFDAVNYQRLVTKAAEQPIASVPANAMTLAYEAPRCALSEM